MLTDSGIVAETYFYSSLKNSAIHVVFHTVLSMSDIFLFWFSALGKRETQQSLLNFLGIDCQICRCRKHTFSVTVGHVGQDNGHSRKGAQQRANCTVPLRWSSPHVCVHWRELAFK